ncbi:alkaline phosphatase family protein [Planctomyces sp. SH-PL62]|uniref:alkaline phosphatase family protein n=1 Tax=Planctomyces sp. SH-PL62 TaxID=1636152 RepID=UPI00078D0AFF|nr:alkaline phosphatase family protein [Planctomyces sp. SH-PL62]AMV38787.1 Type I phosphodiesterase / nucleotide pyrophosphatase [Planctomyces sp. SH-PL62]
MDGALSGAAIHKVIVIGLDGLEPSLVEPMLARGELPHLERLAGTAGLARVATTAPAQTPVAWSTFATGVNPGGHGVFDFLRRDPATYRIDSGLNHYEQKNALLPPKAVNQRRGTTVWDLLTAAGVPSTVLRCPCSYPPDRLRGSLLAGMGVPDLRGGFGTSTYYTAEPDAAARESENLVALADDGLGPVTTHVIGPRNPKTRADHRVEVQLVRASEAGVLTIRSPGEPRELHVREGEWSGWLKVKFKLGPLQSAHGLVRFLLIRRDPTILLYASPVNFDPAAPLFPISAPPEFARKLADGVGKFHTAGFVEDHNGLINERISEEQFLAQCDDAWRERRAMMEHELARFDSGLFYCLFDTPDRVQHMLWRFREPEHPANRGRPETPALATAIEDHYRRSDEVVGQALDHVDDRTLLVVLSDHGFSSFQRQFHLNSWLHREGLLALKPGIAPGHEAGEFLQGIDWEKTRAYAMGLSGVFLNLQGREGRGIVAAEDAEPLRRAIAEKLTGVRDDERGRTAVRSARPRDRVYSGPHVDEAPDVIVDYAPGHRVSWSSSMGGVAGSLHEDNVKKWSGDHCIDPAATPGVLLMNRTFRREGPSLVDLAPTILDAFGVEKGPLMEGSSLKP